MGLFIVTFFQSIMWKGGKKVNPTVDKPDRYSFSQVRRFILVIVLIIYTFVMV